MSFTHALSTNNYGPAKLIVAASAANGTHTTLATAMAAASVGDTIFLRDSVTENVTVTPGVNIVGYTGIAGTSVPTITGTLTMSGAGTSILSRLKLSTNAAAAIAVTGAAASVLVLENCFLNCSNNTGITFSSSSVSAQITLSHCSGDLGTTGIAYFADSSAGTLSLLYTDFQNTGGSSTASTKSAGLLIMKYSSLLAPVTYSSTSVAASILNSDINTSAINATSLTTSGTGTLTVQHSNLNSGSAAAISIGSGTTVAGRENVIRSSAANAVTGAGNFEHCGNNLVITTTINPSTQTGEYIQLAQFQASQQPAFLAIKNTGQSNATGDGTVATISWQTEIFDQNSNFASNTFTAPKTGRYLLSTTLYLQGLTASHNSMNFSIVTTNRSYTMFENVGAMRDSANSLSITCNAIADMTAGDTATVTLAVSGGTKVVSITWSGAATDPRSWFCGQLLA